MQGAGGPAPKREGGIGWAVEAARMGSLGDQVVRWGLAILLLYEAMGVEERKNPSEGFPINSEFRGKGSYPSMADNLMGVWGWTFVILSFVLTGEKG